MNMTLRPHQPMTRVSLETPASALLQDSRLASQKLQDAFSNTPAVSGIKNQDIYRSGVVGAGIGGVSGAISGLFNPKATVQKSTLVGATAGAVNGIVVGVITQQSRSRFQAMIHSSLASAGIGVLQNAVVGKHNLKGVAVGALSGAFRGARLRPAP